MSDCLTIWLCRMLVVLRATCDDAVMFDGRKAGYSKSLDGKYDETVYASNYNSYQCRSLALLPSSPQKTAFYIPLHASSSADTHLKNEYEPLTVISIKKKATQTYPTSRQNTISAFVQGIPIFSWTMK